MNIAHSQNNRFSIEESVNSRHFSTMLANCRGDFLWLGPEPLSRYQGGFFEIDCHLYKIVDDIRALGIGRISKVTNNFWNISRQGNFEEKFFLVNDRSCLVYETAEISDIEIFLDVREIYSNPEFGRDYQVRQIGEIILISYRQDSNLLLPEIFIAICGDISGVKIKQNWVRRDYQFDQERNSSPFEKWVFCPAVLRASEIAVAVGTTQNQVISSVKNVWHNLAKIKKEKARVSESFSRQFLHLSEPSFGGQNRVARYCAANALKMLLMKQNSSVGLRAGLPWFFQFWLRDEAVSINGLASFDIAAANSILKWQLNEMEENGFNSSGIDSPGWFFLRAAEFINAGKIGNKDIGRIKSCLGKEIAIVLAKNKGDDLITNDPGQTWMDSLDRSGACIEIQALRLNMYALAVALAKTKKERALYLKLKKSLSLSVRQKFFDGNRLADRFGFGESFADFTVRPNIFLAAYIYPELLSSLEWTVCFDYALSHLWLDWGGLSTINKCDLRFTGNDTGENSKSYHNGDSWFYVNNLAAVVMARVDFIHFKNYIEEIFKASTNDLLWQGAIGCASEVSSADIFAPAGCPNQAWSNATYLELCRELDKH